MAAATAWACGGGAAWPCGDEVGGPGGSRASAACDTGVSRTAVRPVTQEGWTPLFNGRDLEGWTPKIRGLPAGEDPHGTFRVVADPQGWDGGRQGLLTVSYEGYTGEFDDRFGHLFYRQPYSDYDLLVEYRFVGRQAAGGPDWAWRNSGVMIHAQSPGSMGVAQDFPISLEAQFLGGGPDGVRPTANLCTPGTHVRMEGQLVSAHCVEARAPTVRDDRWVTVVLRVRGSREITHYVQGDPVLAYTDPVVGGGVVSGHESALKVNGTSLERGYIALQSESHPVQFRRVWIRTPGLDNPGTQNGPATARVTGPRPAREA